MMNADGVDLVLRRLSSMGCEPRPAGTDGWQAHCPVHGGPYPALLVRRDGDGSVSVKCRYVNRKGESCPEAEIWKSLGLQPQQLISVPEMREGEPSGPGGAELREAWPDDGPETAVAADGVALDVSPQQTTTVANAPKRFAWANASADGRSGRIPMSHSRMLRRLAREVRVVRGLDDRFYAQVPVAGHREVHELGSRSFEGWLVMQYLERHKAMPSRDRLKSLSCALEADAAGLASTETVWIRVADGTGRERAASPLDPSVAVPGGPDADAVYYVDLGDSSWQSLEIRADGCRITDRAPVLFRRPRSLRALPEPRWNGSIELLKKYANVTDAEFALLVGWMTAALRPAGPYPVLILTGEQGAAKSTLARVVRRLIDPSVAPLRGLPISQRDFMIQAHHTWILAYDNVSSISDTLSDSLCRNATGGGFSTRSLYSNDNEALFDVERPAIVTGIDDFVHRSDLIDRCVFLHMPAIPEEARRAQQAFWSEFDADCPLLLGALLTAVSGGLRMLPQINLPALPRMADFAQWGEAVIRGLGGEPGSFLNRYNANRRAACESVLDDCEVAQALRAMMDVAAVSYRGTATELLRALASYTPKSTVRSARWPGTPRLLACALRRIAPQLRTIGITLSFDRINNARMITISPSNR